MANTRSTAGFIDHEKRALESPDELGPEFNQQGQDLLLQGFPGQCPDKFPVVIRRDSLNSRDAPHSLLLHDYPFKEKCQGKRAGMLGKQAY